MYLRTCLHSITPNAHLSLSPLSLASKSYRSSLTTGTFLLAFVLTSEKHLGLSELLWRPFQRLLMPLKHFSTPLESSWSDRSSTDTSFAAQTYWANSEYTNR